VKAGLLSHDSNDSLESQRVYTRYLSPVSPTGLRSSKLSNPGDFDTWPALFANRSSKPVLLSSGTVIAFITTKDTYSCLLDRPVGESGKEAIV
jgi:hypothetical protein